MFVWDHLRWREPVVNVADPWNTLTAIAIATERVRIGPMVTPLARRRPVKVARETATLDRLSGGRLTLGVGLGNDQAGRELSITGEEIDDRRRARMLDESLHILTVAWSGGLDVGLEDVGVGGPVTVELGVKPLAQVVDRGQRGMLLVGKAAGRVRVDRVFAAGQFLIAVAVVQVRVAEIVQHVIDV